jgi:Fic family protein
MPLAKNYQSKVIEKIEALLDELKEQADWQVVLNPWLRTELTYTSNSLEGNTLSLLETSLVINDDQGVAGKSLREINEAKNHSLAWDFIQQNLVIKNIKELNQHDLLDIHGLILKNIDDFNAGKYRNVAVRIAGSQSLFPNHLKVTDLMTEVFDWLTKTDLNNLQKILETATLLHLKIVKIHPFTDGNGRTARLFMNTVLMQENIPPINILPEDRKEYLESLETSSGENFESFYNFLLQTYVKNLDVYLKTFTK